MSKNLIDREIIHGPLLTVDERPEARDHFNYILRDVVEIRTRYMRLGFHLREFERYKYYRDFGFSSLAEFCDANLSLDKSALSRCLAVYDKFSSLNDDVIYCQGLKKTTNDMSIGQKWEAFSYSQLCEMVSMDNDLRKQVNPDMTIAQIRELKKKKRETSTPPSDVSQVATSQQENVDSISSGANLKCFKFSKYFSLHGAARSTYVKHVDSSRSVRLFLFDEFGAPVFVYSDFDVLYFDDSDVCIALRACPSTCEFSELSNANGQP